MALNYRPWDTPTGSQTGEVPAGLTSGGGRPRRTADFYDRLPGRNPQGWSPSYGIPGSGGFQMLTGGSGTQNLPGGGSISRSVSGLPASAYQGGGAMNPFGAHVPGWRGPGLPVGQGDWQITGDPGGGPNYNTDLPYGMPTMQLPDLPGFKGSRMPTRIEINGTVVNFSDPVQLQMALIGYYGQRGQQMASMYGMQLQYQQAMRLGHLQAQTTRQGYENQRILQQRQQENAMDAFGEIMGQFGGDDFDVMGPGEQEWNARAAAASAQNAGDVGAASLARTNAATGPGGGMAGAANLGPMAAHSRAMADQASISDLRRQRREHEVARMGGIAQILQGVR